MMNIRLNVSLLREKVPNLTVAAKQIGIRSATVSNLCTGKIPLAKAEVQTLVRLSMLAGCSIDELIIYNNKLSVIETGIKVIDCLAPLRKGSVTGLVARKDMGQLVLIAELFYRLKRKGFKTMLIHPNQIIPGVAEVKKESEFIASSKENAILLIKEQLNNEDVLIVMDRAHVIQGDLRYLQQQDLDKLKSITILLVDLKGEAVDEELPFGPLDTLWGFDSKLVAQKKYPALDPLSSYSDDGFEASNTLRFQKDMKRYLRRYQELRTLYSQKGYDKLPEEETFYFQVGERLEAYFTQPFFISEPYTKRKGESVSYKKLMHDLQEILAGKWNHEPISYFMYKGSLDKR
ncbi:hypothetical protein ACE1TH_07025 [Shouchella sp. JSM 1781072]|uniref:hypothetical protein n=1 Tax=Bacillaceae TaxID=186817 RepID=UPI000C084A42|nr:MULTISPECIES: hypothetical protein [Bacillaceae]UTR08134.1 hypothetical protein MM326_09010 [Alkalihalobacillus sp. LMS6]